MGDLTEHFSRHEFECSCCKQFKIDNDFLERLERARVVAGIPFQINSGYRCEKKNREVGGVDSSAHTEGKAADIKTVGPRSRFTTLEALLEVGFTRIGIAKTYIHADCDESKDPMVVWLY